MCEQCSAEVNEFGHPLEGWMLCRATKNGSMMKKNEWGLVRSDDPTYVWSVNPRVDPTANLTDEQIDTMSPEDSEKWYDFLDAAETFCKALKSYPFDGHLLYEAAVAAGYKRESGSFSQWLFDYLARWLIANPIATGQNSLTKEIEDDVGDRLPIFKGE